MDLVSRKNQIEAKLRTNIQNETGAIGKTRSKKSSPDMFNLYAILTSHDTVTVVGRASIFRHNFNSPSIQRKSTKNEGLSENMGFTGKTV